MPEPIELIDKLNTYENMAQEAQGEDFAYLPENG